MPFIYIILSVEVQVKLRVKVVQVQVVLEVHLDSVVNPIQENRRNPCTCKDLHKKTQR